MADRPLTGVVALVSFRADSTFNFKHSISTKLTDLGAKVTKRFGKDVTHIVFQKRLQPNTEQLIAERADLRALHDKALKEQKYAIARPSDDDLLGHKGSGLTPGSSGRKRSRKTMQPKDLKELEVDTTDAIFSSSQLIREQSKADVDMGEVSSPAPPHKRPKHAQQPVTRFVRYDGSQKAAKAKTQSQHDQQATDAGASNPTAARTARGGNTIAAALSRQKQRQGQASTKGAQNRLTKQPAGTGAKQKREDSAAEAEQAKKSGSNSAVLHFEGRQPSEQKACSTDAVQPDSNSKLRPASAGGTKSVTRCRRSRLIKATGSYVDAAASAEAAHDLQQCKGIAKPVLGQQREPDLHQLSLQCNDTDMLSAAATLILPLVPDSQQQAEKGNAQQQNTDDGKPPEQQGTVGGDPPDQQGTDVADPPMQQGTDKDPAELQSTDLGDQPQKPCVTLPEPAAVQQQQHSLLAAPVLIPGGSSRFSTRHLKQKVDAKLPVSKATPVGLPPTPMLPQLQQPSHIPIPEFTRVPSPWITTPSDPSQATPAAFALLTQPAIQPGPLAASSSQPASVTTAAAALPVWSAVRPWDVASKEGPQKHAAAPSAISAQPVASSNSIPQAAQNPDAGKPATCVPEQQPGRQAMNGHAGPSGQTADEEGMHEAEDLDQGGSPAAGPLNGCLSLSCVDGSVHEVARNAVRSLRGVRLCSEGHEEGRLTHLVLGQPRRTLKVLLAIAAGAFLVTPDWLTASLEAGEWLPEEPFLAKGRFADAAQAARGVSDHAKPEPLLHGRKVYVHVAEAAKKGASSGNGSALRRLVTALGGKVAGPKSCGLCIISGGGTRPSNLSAKILAVKEEWLLKGTEQYKLESTRLYAVK